MNRNLISLSFGVLFLFGVITGIGAQTVDLREISVKKNRPDEIFHKAATVISFWITDEVGSFETIIKQDSHITVFEDDRGLNLIAAHYKEITAWEEQAKMLAGNGRYVSMGRSQELLSAVRLELIYLKTKNIRVMFDEIVGLGL